MSKVEKLRLGGQLLFAAFGGVLGSPFLLLGSALAWLIGRDWVGLSIGTTAYAALLAWIAFVVIRAILAMLMAPAHTDRLSPWRANIVEFVSCIGSAVVGFTITADQPVRGAILGVGVGLVMIGGFEWMASDDTLTEEEEAEAWDRFNADLRKEFGHGGDEEPT